MHITPENTIFMVLSFEGPDIYSMAGGLGARISYLTQTLAGMNFDHPNGVYDGEEGKLYDFNESVPLFVVHELAAPAISQGKMVVVLGEEWHTAEAMSRISDLLYVSGRRNNALMFWNANNTYSFDRINWARLSHAITITTVSKYMKHIMLRMGINPLVIPNGLPEGLLGEVDDRAVSRLKVLLDGKLVLSKVARWHPDKGWKSAVKSVRRLKETGKEPVLLARGGIEPYGTKILREARSIGLTVKDVSLELSPPDKWHREVVSEQFEPYLEAISKAGSGDILDLQFPMPHSFLNVMYRASDVVLANSAREPFGLVDLEAMATGAIVFTGCTGEDYATHLVNAVVLDTFSAEEVAFYIERLQEHMEEKERIRAAARETAKQFTWEKVVKRLIRKLEYQAHIQGFF